MADLKRRLRERKKTTRWCVYLLECSDGSYYCGITTDLDRRVSEHNSGLGAKYTRGRGPVKLITATFVEDRSTALRLESATKKKRKKEKVKFLQSH